MTRRNAPLVALIVSLIVLAQLIGGISCLVRKSGPDSLIETAREVVYTQMKLLEEQKFEEPDTPAPLEVNIDSVESETTRIGRDGGNVYLDVGIDVGMGAGAGGGIGGGIGGGMGGGGG
jgi:hypothetical protein